MDIPAGKNILEIYTREGVKEIPLNEAQACIREACNYCIDSTAEYADISVGAARFAGTADEQRGWNQLIVRTEKGRELIDLANKARCSGSKGSSRRKFAGIEKGGSGEKEKRACKYCAQKRLGKKSFVSGWWRCHDP